jgi:hypothetical protein
LFGDGYNVYQIEGSQGRRFSTAGDGRTALSRSTQRPTYGRWSRHLRRERPVQGDSGSDFITAINARLQRREVGAEIAGGADTADTAAGDDFVVGESA